MRGLPRSQQPDNQKLVSPTFGWKIIGLTGLGSRFTQLNLTNAYHQMKIRERNKWKTAFRTRYGHFEYQVIPFELTKARVTFQNYINKILAKNLNIFVIVYLDDIFIYIESKDEEYI